MASCLAVFLARMPPELAAPWVRRTLAPLHQTAGESEGATTADGAAEVPILWLLARKLSAAIAGDPGEKGPLGVVVAWAADCVAESMGCGSSAKAETRGLRALAALVHAGALQDEGRLKATGSRMRAILGRAGVPVALRAEAWAAHAEVCLQMDAADELRVSLLYAVRYLADHPSTGARVADVLARARGRLLGGASQALEGLCGATVPLRLGGLAAAAAIVKRGASAGADPAPAAVEEVAHGAVEAFEEEQHRDGGTRAKRRRLLREIVQDSEAAGVLDPDLKELCVAARARIDGWLRP